MASVAGGAGREALACDAPDPSPEEQTLPRPTPSGSRAAPPAAGASAPTPAPPSAPSSNIALALFGGAAPLAATWLIQTTGNVLSPALYLTLSAAITLGVLWTMRETYREALR